MPTVTTCTPIDTEDPKQNLMAPGFGCEVIGRGVMLTSTGFEDTGNSEDNNILLNPQKLSL